MKIFAQFAASWRAQPRKNQNAILVIVSLLLVAVYFSVFWSRSHGKRQDIEYSLAKQAIRNRKSGTASQVKPSAQDVIQDSPARLGQDLEKLDRQLEQVRADRLYWRERFLDLENPEVLKALQTLKMGITRLAESGDMEIQSLEHVFRNEGERDRPATVERLQTSVAQNPYSRPLLRFKARASYRGLMQFLHGLEGLPHVVAPVRSNIEVKVDNSDGQRVWLDVEFDLAV